MQAELKEQIVSDLLVLPEIAETLFPLGDLGKEMQAAFKDLFELVVRIRKAYVQLREG